MKARFILIAAVLLAASCSGQKKYSDDPQIAAVQQLAGRILPKQSANIDFVLEEGQGMTCTKRVIHLA